MCVVQYHMGDDRSTKWTTECSFARLKILQVCTCLINEMHNFIHVYVYVLQSMHGCPYI